MNRKIYNIIIIFATIFSIIILKQDLNDWDREKEGVIKEYIGKNIKIEENIFINKEKEIKKIVKVLDKQLNIKNDFDYEDKRNRKYFINSANQIISLIGDKGHSGKAMAIYKYKIVEIYKEKSFSWIMSKIVWFFIIIVFIRLLFVIKNIERKRFFHYFIPIPMLIIKELLLIYIVFLIFVKDKKKVQFIKRKFY